MNPLEKLATKQHLISLLTKTAEDGKPEAKPAKVDMPATLVQDRPRAKFDVPHDKYIKQIKKKLKRQARRDKGSDQTASVHRTHRSGPDKPKTTTWTPPGGGGDKAKATHLGVDHYQGVAKLVQARRRAKFKPLYQGPGDTPEQAARKAATRKKHQKSDLQTKLFGVGSLRRGWKPPTDTSKLTGMQRDYLARNQGNMSSVLDEKGNFLPKKPSQAVAAATPKAPAKKAPAKSAYVPRQRLGLSSPLARTPAAKPAAKPAATQAAATPKTTDQQGRPTRTPDGKPIRYIDIKKPMVIKGYAPPKSLVGANYASRKRYIEHMGGKAGDRSTWNKDVRAKMNDWWKGHVAAKQKAKATALAQR